MGDDKIKTVKVHAGRDEYGNAVIGHISFGPKQDDESMPVIDVPTLMRDAGWDEAIEAAAKVVEKYARDRKGSLDFLAELIRDLRIKK